MLFITYQCYFFTGWNLSIEIHGWNYLVDLLGLKRIVIMSHYPGTRVNISTNQDQMANKDDGLTGEDANGPTSTPQHLINVNKICTRECLCSSADCTTCKDPERDSHHVWDLSQALGSSPAKVKSLQRSRTRQSSCLRSQPSFRLFTR